MANDLRPKQQRFVEEYFVDFNGTRAAIRAGYSRKSARAIAQENLTKPDIVAAIQAKRDQLTEKCNLTTEAVLHHIACICFADPRKLYDRKGRLLMPHQLDSITAAAIASIECSGKTGKYRFWSKTEALNLAGRYLKLFKEDAPTQPLTRQYVILAPATATLEEWCKLVQQHQGSA